MSSMVDFEGLDRAVREIRETVEVYAGGWKNEDALGHIREQTFIIQHGCDGDPYICEKLGGIESSAGIFFSVHKSKQFGGPEAVKGQIYADCQNILSRLDHLRKITEGS